MYIELHISSLVLLLLVVWVVGVIMGLGVLNNG